MRAVPAVLYLLLFFSTFTVFVREAWALQFFQIGVYALVGANLLAGVRRGAGWGAGGVAPRLVYLIPLWAVVQLLGHITISSFETRQAALRWGSLAGVFFLSQTVNGSRTARRTFLTVFLCFATGMALLCLLQMFTSQGRVLWVFSTGYPDVYATFPNSNNYAQFVELALPIALWRAFREVKRSWWYGLAGGVLYASVIGAASRAGALLCSAELLAMLLIGALRMRKHRTGLSPRRNAWALVLIPALAVLFAFAVGEHRVWDRFKASDPYATRREFTVAAMEMAAHRPWAGFGLGTFPQVYPQFEIKDFPFYANHAHNDWAEFAAEGGIPFLLLVLIPFAAVVPTAIRHPWGLGLIAVMLHACVDYPFPRPAVSGWMFALLGALYMARDSENGARDAAVTETASVS